MKTLRWLCRESVQFRKRKRRQRKGSWVSISKKKKLLSSSSTTSLPLCLKTTRRVWLNFRLRPFLNLPIIIFVALPSRNGLKVAFGNFWPRGRRQRPPNFVRRRELVLSSQIANSMWLETMDGWMDWWCRNRTYWTRFFISRVLPSVNKWPG